MERTRVLATKRVHLNLFQRRADLTLPPLLNQPLCTPS